MTQSRQLKTIMFTDIEGYTAMMQKDEERAIVYRQRHRKVFDKLTAKFRGEVLQYYGDGTLSIFDNTIDAVECGIEIQMELLQEPKIPVRIGIDSRRIYFDGREIIGEEATIASFIEKLTQSGAVLISDQAYHLIKDQNAIETLSLGQFNLKNIKRPVEVFAITNKGLHVPEKDAVREKFKGLKIGKPGRRSLKTDRIVVGGILLLIFIMGLAYLMVFLIEQTSIPVNKSIAVLPFTNLSDDPQQEYFSDGITEEIIDRLAQIQDLKVISRTSIMNYKNSTKPLKEIGKELGVSNILEGSIRKSGDQIRVSAQLIQVDTDYSLWAKPMIGLILIYFPFKPTWLSV